MAWQTLGPATPSPRHDHEHAVNLVPYGAQKLEFLGSWISTPLLLQSPTLLREKLMGTLANERFPGKFVDTPLGPLMLWYLSVTLRQILQPMTYEFISVETQFDKRLPGLQRSPEKSLRS